MRSQVSCAGRFGGVGALSAAALAAILAVACGGATTGGTTKDAGTGHADSGKGAPDAGTVVGPCGTDDDCPSGATCQFLIGSCSAKGQCIEGPGSGCQLVEELCGCGDAGAVYSGCAFASGYASGPTTGSQSGCGLGAPSEPDAGSPGQPLPEAGTSVGPCGAGGTCAKGEGCFFPIGSCPSTGACIVLPSQGGTCGAEESLCGCDGTPVTTGCGYPSGYASGPTNGSAFCGAAPVPDGG